jgi:CRISPR-associated endonuclease/helicase Cas3
MNSRDMLLVWAKSRGAKRHSPHPLLWHMLDTAAVCEALGVVPALGATPPGWLPYLAALHDIGKADPAFQCKDEELAGRLRAAGLNLPRGAEAFRHEARSAEWLRPHLTDVHYWGRGAARIVAQAVRGHHADFHADAVPDADADRSAQWQHLRDELAAVVAAALSLSPWAPSEFEHASRTGAALTGLIVLCDWIASNEELFETDSTLIEVADYWAIARRTAQQAVARLRLDFGVETAKPSLRFRDLWPGLVEMRPVQAKIEELCEPGIPPGLAIIEAPTGDGKTEAAIYLSEHWQHAAGRAGAYLALPTAATSNQMHVRYKEFLEREHPGSAAPRLVHGMAWLLDDASPLGAGQQEEGEDSREMLDWFRNAKRALLAPEGVGTVDQALMAALNVKFGFLRLFGLAAKVLVIDEVHAYDEYMTTIMCRLLEWCRATETPVILLSATLSAAQKRRLAEAYAGADALLSIHGDDPYPLLTFVPLNGQASTVAVRDARTRRVRLRSHDGLIADPERTARLAAAEVRNGGCCCVLVNAVADAQAVYLALRRLHPLDADLHLFHARFRAERRQEIEETVTALFGKDAGKKGQPPRPQRAILVSTQVVEQSLDVDFDVMISQIAPIDLLLQRAGRLHRHDRDARPTGPEPVLHVLLPEPGTFDFGATQHVYHREPLLHTLACLHGRAALDLPSDLRPLIEACYGEESIPPGVVPEDLLAAASRERQAFAAQAENKARVHLIPEPSSRVFSLAKNPYRPVGDGDEGATADYFHAQTRLGDKRRRALMLHAPAHFEIMRNAKPPDRDTLRRLFLQMVDLPAWWLEELSAAAAADAITDAPPWARGCVVVPLRDGAWRGRDADGRAIALVDDPELGLVRRTDDNPE